MIPLDGVPVEVSELLVGSKKAVWLKDRLVVSPAMFDLMRHASPDELETLLKSIGLINLDKYDPFAAPIQPQYFADTGAAIEIKVRLR